MSEKSSVSSHRFHGNNKTAACVRNVATFSHVVPAFKFDKPGFNAAALKDAVPVAAPKLQALMDKIEAVDRTDMKQHGRLFKHVIYVDYKGVLAKVVTGALIANGFNMIFDDKFVIDETPGKRNLACLSSTALYDKNVPVRFRKELVALFNRRPDNVHGKHLRFLVLDSGFREGIDCFDVKYMHIIQPLATPADATQAIGRATRFCGQKGLTFHPAKGWPLVTFTYDTEIPTDLKKHLEDGESIDTAFQLYMRYSGIDTRRLVLAKELDKLVVEGAVDYPLTKAIHNFSIKNSTEDEERIDIFDGGMKGRRVKKAEPMTPIKIHKHEEMREYIKQRFGQFTWPEGKLENLCEQKGGGKSQIVEFTPAQQFVRHYFKPFSAYKGMLLDHGVGVGKTCTAIATASTSWEQEGYTILWVTRHTLKADIWKNMFQQVCSLVIQDKLKKCDIDYLDADEAVKEPLKHLSKNWMAPISFKQFSNMCQGKNDIYKKLVQRNGAKDPLRKTLIILDEAHKLFASDVVGAEKPDPDAIKKALHKSYTTSDKDSVRVLLMTATPYTSDPMGMMKLLNLIRSPNSQLPDEFDDFSKEYLDDDGAFTTQGKRKFLDDIAGYISYVNREKDARQFAYPKHHRVIVAMSRSQTILHRQHQVELQNRIKDLDVPGAEKRFNDAKKDDAERIRELKARCKGLPKADRPECENELQAFKDASVRRLETLRNALQEVKDNVADMKKAIAFEKKANKNEGKEDASQEYFLLEKCLQ
jgi:superfamily II DNA or RNA helicase